MNGAKEHQVVRFFGEGGGGRGGGGGGLEACVLTYLGRQVGQAGAQAETGVVTRETCPK